MENNDATLAFVGTYSDASKTGIYSYQFNREAGILSELYKTSGGTNPSFLTTCKNRNYLYALNETDTGTVRGFEIAATGFLTETNVVDSGGSGPCHCSAVGEYLVVAHYTEGIVSLLPIGNDGWIGKSVDIVKHEGSSSHPKRQTQPHPHSAISGPKGKYVYVPDLGTDQIVCYRLDSKEGKLLRRSAVALPNGAGPRHLVINSIGNVAYVTNELDSTISIVDIERTEHKLKVRETTTTLPNGSREENFTADIHLHPSGKWLYVSNRGYNTIAIFAIDENGGLTLQDHEHTRGEWPRNFAVDPTGRWLIAENMRSDNIVIFTIDQTTGKLTMESKAESISKPACITFH